MIIFPLIRVTFEGPGWLAESVACPLKEQEAQVQASAGYNQTPSPIYTDTHPHIKKVTFFFETLYVTD